MPGRSVLCLVKAPRAVSNQLTTEETGRCRKVQGAPEMEQGATRPRRAEYLTSLSSIGFDDIIPTLPWVLKRETLGFPPSCRVTQPLPDLGWWTADPAPARPTRTVKCREQRRRRTAGDRPRLTTTPEQRTPRKPTCQPPPRRPRGPPGTGTSRCRKWPWHGQSEPRAANKRRTPPQPRKAPRAATDQAAARNDGDAPTAGR